ncbi:hypothetical protein N7527_004273 [Penicillium freii]|nr:hypothetical protein N7527_004273 [Penicillium freii]
MQVDIDPVLTRPILWHGDLHSSNLFTDDGHITAIIGWQGFKNIQIDAISALSAGDQRAQPSSRQSVPSRPWEDKASTSRICRKHMG